ncbi:hypothetical protein DIJ60_14805 [Burkholderia pseudomallei]|nr:hypothetical protein DIJ60_14805 [Burkholderia pseudomallei]
MKYEWARTRRLSAALAVAAFVAAGCGKHESEHDAAAPREAFVQRICAVREHAAPQEGAGFPRYGLAG